MPTLLETAPIPALLKRLNKQPPFYVYYMARKWNYGKVRKRNFGNSRPLCRPLLRDLIKKSGIPARTFVRIAAMLTWDNVKMKHIEPFITACGIDVARYGNLHDYIRKSTACKRPFQHLTDHQIQTFNRQCARWLALQEQMKEESK